jgi:DNA repair exonuclease SbcCD ATPase subunit
VAQYIRTHDHGDIADSADRNDNKLFSFFFERHNRRKPLSDAIAITGIELKDFTGDREYVEMRRKARMDERQNQIERQQAEYQQELNRLKALHKADNERMEAEHQANMQTRATEHKVEIETMEARHEKEKQDILKHVKELEIELNNKRQHLQRRENEFSKAIEAISAATSSANLPLNSDTVKTMTELLAALKEEVDNNASSKQNRITRPTGADKVEKLTNTLLNLLNPKK